MSNPRAIETEKDCETHMSNFGTTGIETAKKIFREVVRKQNRVLKWSNTTSCFIICGGRISSEQMQELQKLIPDGWAFRPQAKGTTGPATAVKFSHVQS